MRLALEALIAIGLLIAVMAAVAVVLAIAGSTRLSRERGEDWEMDAMDARDREAGR